MTGVSILLDEHVGRVFEHVLNERGYEVEQAKDVFGEHTRDDELLEWCGEHTRDDELLEWCGEHNAVLLTNNARDFEELHSEMDHAGILLYYEQNRPDEDPEGLAHVVDEVFTQYGASGVENELIDLGEWYGWVHG